MEPLLRIAQIVGAALIALAVVLACLFGMATALEWLMFHAYGPLLSIGGLGLLGLALLLICGRMDDIRRARRFIERLAK